MIHYRHGEVDGLLIHFVSLDGDVWLPINREPQQTPEDEAALRALFEGDGNFMPMVFSRGMVDHLIPA